VISLDYVQSAYNNQMIRITNNFDLVIKPDVTIREQNEILLNAMYEWGWFEQHEGL
jgi:hypothetical protein